MPVRTIRVDPHLKAAVAGARWREWELLADELCADLRPGEALFHEVPEEELVLSVDDEWIMLRVPGEEPRQVAQREPLAPIVKEYLGVIELLEDESIPMARAEVLDMAKRVVHDKGASTLGDLLPGLTVDHERRRRLFSLLVALSTDTTKKRLAHRHP
jgi:hypothetical protein